jgi:hypothetical protein
MKILRALFSLAVSILFVVILAVVVILAENKVDPRDLSSIDLGAPFIGIIAGCSLMPIICWFFVFLPLLFLTRRLDAWTWPRAGLFGCAAGGVITGALLALFRVNISTKGWVAVLVVTMGVAFGIQCALGSLTAKWGKNPGQIDETPPPSAQP